MRSKWVLLLIVSLAGAVEVYDESMHEGGPPETDQYDTMASSQSMEHLAGADDQAAAELLLYKLLAAPHSGKILTFPYRSRWINSEVENKGRLMLPKRLMPSGFDIFNEKRASSQNTRSSENINLSPRAQPKWKIKKGSQMVCYFKLCAFRPYS